jgi:hypothetical protein
MIEAMWGVITAHERHMHQRLPAATIAQLRSHYQLGPRPPLTASQQAFLEQVAHLRVFEPTALNAFQAPHTWVDKNNRQLADRIWRTGRKLREQVDDLLSQGMRQAVPIPTLTTRLARFLQPDRAAFPTGQPFGTDGAYQPLLLAGAEITLAHGHTALTVARMNPFVDAMIFKLSDRHPKPDECDDFAAGSPYPVNGFVPMPVQDTHIKCLCEIVPDTSRPPLEVAAEILEAVLLGQTLGISPYLTPLEPRLFFAQLMGAGLSALIPEARVN